MNLTRENCIKELKLTSENLSEDLSKAKKLYLGKLIEFTSFFRHFHANFEIRIV